MTAVEKTATHSTARVNKQTQFNNNGLVILKALYGDIIELGEQLTTAYKPGKCVDISMELQANCDPVNCSLIIQQNGQTPLYQRIKDIANPNSTTKNKLIRNRLSIVYYFHGELHYTIYEDTESIILPIQDHQCAQIRNDGTYPDLEFLLQSYPQWAPLLPSPESDQAFEIAGTDWDADWSYQNVPYEYQQILRMRPETVYVEPRRLAYERLLKLEEEQMQWKVLFGLGLGAVGVLGVLQGAGVINVCGWPGFNLFFSTPQSTTPQSISAASAESKETDSKQ